MTSISQFCADPQLSEYDYGTTSGGGGTYTFDANSYDCYRIQIAHTANINPSGSYSSGIFYRVVWYVVNGGVATITWDGKIKWKGGAAPTFTTSGTDIVIFTTIDGGTTWQGSLAGQDYK